MSDELKHRIIMACVASCTCHVKSPEPKYHAHDCRYRVLMDAHDALSRPAPAVQVPVGWALVPVEPTPEMLAATSWPGCAATDYEHMLAAAPAPATVATEAVAQGGGVDVEKVMALVEEYGEAKWSQGDSQYRRGCQSSADYYSEDAGRIRDRIRALLSASPAGVDGWQPIETAPKDGSWILVIRLGYPQVVVRWNLETEKWCTCDDLIGDYDNWPLDYWQPLPSPPAIANQEPQDGR